MHRISNIISLILLLAAAGSCVYDFNPQVEGNTGTLVVDGDILAGDVSVIRLSRAMALDTVIPVGVPDDWKVWVELEDGSRIEGIRNKSEFTLDTRSLSAGMKCRLGINNVAYTFNHRSGSFDMAVNSEYGTPWLTVQSTPEIDSLSTKVADDLQTMDFCITSPGGGSTPYYRWFGTEDWEYTADVRADVYYDPSKNSVLDYKDGNNSFYCWNRAEVPEIMVGTTNGLSDPGFVNHVIYTYGNHNIKLSYLYSVLLVQENLSEDAYRYWYAMARNSTDVGGLMSSQPSELHGNIYNVNDPSETVIGFVNASEVSSIRYFFDSSLLLFYHRAERFSEEPKAVHSSQWKHYYYDLAYRPAVAHEEETATGERYKVPDTYDWYPRRCIDCTYKGGDKNKPAWWPNNHK